MHPLQSLIAHSWDTRTAWSVANPPAHLPEALDTILSELEHGTLRVAERINGDWIVHPWIKHAVLLYFRCHASTPVSGGFSQFYDKIPLQFSDTSASDFEARQLRVVPPACIRRGAYIGPRTVLMPCFVNMGAYVGEGTMVDTWATVGSCAQIGAHVHLSGGVGIGGVLEPVQAMPTIIEDHCFIGARSEIVEGVIIETGAVIGMGVFIGQSTRIYDRVNDTYYIGRVPPNAVVVSGSMPGKGGNYHLYSAIIVKYADQKTRDKVGLNALLREDT